MYNIAKQNLDVEDSSNCENCPRFMDVADFLKFQNAVCALRLFSLKCLKQQDLYELMKSEKELINATHILSELESKLTQ